MNMVLQKFGATTLSCILLFATFSLHLKMHFCGEHLVDMAVGSKAATCGVEAVMEEVPGTCSMAAMNCCSDLEINLQGQKDLQSSILASAPTPIYTFIPASRGLEEYTFYLSAPKAKLGFNAHSPPPLIKSARIFYGVYII
jgi:hypothetical protein